VSDLEPLKLWQNYYIALWSDGEISVSDGVGFVGTVDAVETRKLYEALRRYYGDDKLESEPAKGGGS
jgi:hypothetical protein